MFIEAAPVAAPEVVPAVAPVLATHEVRVAAPAPASARDLVHVLYPYTGHVKCEVDKML